jgi:Uma2 family endonuclease
MTQALSTAKAGITVGPSDDGRPMSLDEFDQAYGLPGSDYELSRGVITVVDVPNFRHFAQVDTLREQLSAYRRANPGVIHSIGGEGGCKVLIRGLGSERHPDWAIYLSPPPSGGSDIWAKWVPAILIEVVSPSSRQRDYVEKPDEYFLFGVQEYWIVDADRREMLVHARAAGGWAKQPVGEGDPYRTPLVPGFELDLAAIFKAAGS